MDRRKVSGQFSNQGVSSADLERGYSDTGMIPEVGESVFETSTDEAKEGPDVESGFMGSC